MLFRNPDGSINNFWETISDGTPPCKGKALSQPVSNMHSAILLLLVSTLAGSTITCTLIPQSTLHRITRNLVYLYAYLNTNIDIGRIRFAGQFAYQTIQGASVLRLPAFMGNLGVYYTQPLFHRGAILQPGLSFNYNTSYYADNYMPALRTYYLQHNQEVGNYIYMNVFVNIKIQRARFFAEYSHFNAA